MASGLIGKSFVDPCGTSMASLHSGSPRAAISNGNAQQRLLNPPTPIDYKSLRFLITDAPSEGNLPVYLREFEKRHVTDVVRACEPTYSQDELSQRGILLHELNFKDGDPPPPHVVASWLGIVCARFLAPKPAGVPYGTVAVHCVAGLGRAPVLVAIALIEAGMPNLEAVEFIRSRRRGALNVKQVRFLDEYKRRGKGRLANIPQDAHSPMARNGASSTSRAEKCTIM